MRFGAVEASARLTRFSGFTASFVLENTTRRDYRLPERLAIYQRGKRVKNLRTFGAHIVTDRLPIPAGQRAQLDIVFGVECDVDLKNPGVTEQCFRRVTEDLDSLMWVDEDSGIRVELPRPVLKASDQR